MKDVKTYIESGILESYLLGSLSDAEQNEVLEMIANHPEIQEEIEAISFALEAVAFENAVPPDPTLKPFLMATIDFTERMESGEIPGNPPALHENSKISDYSEWLDRPDMVLKNELEDVYAKIIGYTPEQITAIVWIKEMAPEEIHTNEFERFLIVEGTCDIQIGQNVHHLKPGDYLSIPLYENHFVTVTSPTPCKVILQRVAA